MVSIAILVSLWHTCVLFIVDMCVVFQRRKIENSRIYGEYLRPIHQINDKANRSYIACPLLPVSSLTFVSPHNGSECSTWAIRTTFCITFTTSKIYHHLYNL